MNQTEVFTITGSSGNDTITGGTGADSISGGGGDDVINGAQNDTLLDGGANIDTLQVGANFTSSGNSQIVNIENVTLTSAVTLNLSNQTEGFTITGSAGANSITAGSGADIIVGAQNDTLLDGGGGTDTLQIGANFTSTGNGQIVNIENVTRTSAVTLNLSIRPRLHHHRLRGSQLDHRRLGQRHHHRRAERHAAQWRRWHRHIAGRRQFHQQ